MKKTAPPSFAPVFMYLLATSVGCSSSETTTPAPAAPTKLTVWVLASDTTTIAPEAAPGAKVYFDPPGGGARVEGVAEADGHVTFEVDFTKGEAGLTVVHEGYISTSILGLTPERIKAIPIRLDKPETDVVVALPPTAASLPKLSGAITNKLAADNNVVVSSTRVHSPLVEGLDSFNVSVPRNRPFSLIAAEGKFAVLAPGSRAIENTEFRLYRADHAGLSADGKLDIDLTTATVVTAPKVKWTVELPGGDAGPLGAAVVSRCIASVASFDSTAMIGPLVKSTPTPTGFDAEVQVGQTDIGEQIVSRAVIALSDDSQSVVNELGAMPEGTVFKDFVTPPTLTVERQRVSDPIAVGGVVPGQLVLVQLNGRPGPAAEPQLVWTIIARADAANTITLPTPPPGLVLPTFTQARVVTFTENLIIHPWLLTGHRVGVSKPIAIVK
jgi:hypothetical protein